MKALVVAFLFALPCSAQDTESITQVDRVCIGRMMIVQTWASWAAQGMTKEEFLNIPGNAESMKTLKPPQVVEIMNVVDFIWSHNRQEAEEFGASARAACYEANKGS